MLLFLHIGFLKSFMFMHSAQIFHIHTSLYSNSFIWEYNSNATFTLRHMEIQRDGSARQYCGYTLLPVLNVFKFLQRML